MVDSQISAASPGSESCADGQVAVTPAGNMQTGVRPIRRSMPRLAGRGKARRLGRVLPGTLPLFVDSKVLDEMLAWSQASPRVEVGGFVIGHWCEDPGLGQFLLAEHFLPAHETTSQFASLTFSHNTWRRLQQQLEGPYAGYQVMGWHHTHPGMGVFLSAHDLFIQEHFFSQPWQLAIVVDPCSGQLGVFQWLGAELVNNGFLVLSNRRQKVGGKSYVSN